MFTIANAVFKFAESNWTPSIIQGINDGSMVFSPSNGSIRYAKGELKGRLVKHLDLVPVTPEDLANPQQMLQLATTLASAAVVVGVIVVATAYLAGKIDAVQRSVDAVGGAIAQQDQRENLRIVTNYTGALAAARELLDSNAVASAGNVASGLIKERHRALAYLEGLRTLIDRPGIAADEVDRSLALMIRLLDVMPAALQVERDIGLLTGDHSLAENPSQAPVKEYRRHLGDFRKWCEGVYRRVAAGEGGPAEVLRKHRPALQQLFESPINEFMLSSLEAPSPATGSHSTGLPRPLEALFKSAARSEGKAR